jgi:hypothetical protein
MTVLDSCQKQIVSLDQTYSTLFAAAISTTESQQGLGL